MTQQKVDSTFSMWSIAQHLKKVQSNKNMFRKSSRHFGVFDVFSWYACQVLCKILLSPASIKFSQDLGKPTMIRCTG